MASTSLLTIGSKLKLSNLKARWLKYNNDSGYQIKVSHNIKGPPRARYLSVCYSASKTKWDINKECCKAHIKANGINRDSMEIISVEMQHTCSQSQDRRKRNSIIEHGILPKCQTTWQCINLRRKKKGTQSTSCR